ncbi:DUF2970 domain-containing protein [Comamonadaceae bacterium M7527]|nr:DUF2970 domain-containing protein [Comamonadaceae bacterium M7527]
MSDRGEVNNASKPRAPKLQASARKGSWAATVFAVLWAFLGVRRQSDYESDIGKLKPLHIAVVGIVATFLFVGGLMLLANWVVVNS